MSDLVYVPKGLPDSPPFGNAVIVHTGGHGEVTIVVMRAPVALTPEDLAASKTAARVEAPVVASVTVPAAVALDIAGLINQMVPKK
jgi:hypothetical protein